METEHERFSSRRVVVLSAVLVALGVSFEAAFMHSLSGALSLTGAGVVAIINFRWLATLVERVVQAGQPRFDKGSVLRLLGRLALLAVAMVALMWIDEIDGVAVACGFSTVVVALLVEGMRWARAGGGS